MVLHTKSTQPISEKSIERKWYLIDLKKQILGRSATTIASYLIGKHKANYVDYLDCGDNVVVINASSVEITGNKAQNKTYSRYSGYPGGLKKISFNKLKESNPQEIVRHAVMGMLPKNKLRAKRITRLFVFKDEHHTFEKELKK